LALGRWVVEEADVAEGADEAEELETSTDEEDDDFIRIDDVEEEVS
jgi:hypothetical protein